MIKLPPILALLFIWSSSAPGIVAPVLVKAGPARNLQNQSVTVKGEVAKEGLVPLPKDGKLALQDAIKIAGGFTKKATQRVTLERPGSKPKTYDLKKLEKAGLTVWLQPGDLLIAKLRIF
jgi:protein involved in polysaccharide export with SLBB domain